jgi:sec-independent protein translocase protein TatA
MGAFSIWHWLIVLVVVLVLFGGGGKISRLKKKLDSDAAETVAARGEEKDKAAGS